MPQCLLTALHSRTALLVVLCNSFRVRKCHIAKLAELLGLSEQVKCPRIGVAADRVTALCYLLRRYAYPSRVTVDLPQLFKTSQARIRALIKEVERQLLDRWRGKIDFDHLTLKSNARRYAAAVADKCEGMSRHCVGFLDGTVRGICRPTVFQQQCECPVSHSHHHTRQRGTLTFAAVSVPVHACVRCVARGVVTDYNGHRRKHAIKYQSVTTPDGLIISMCVAARALANLATGAGVGERAKQHRLRILRVSAGLARSRAQGTTCSCSTTQG